MRNRKFGLWKNRHGVGRERDSALAAEATEQGRKRHFRCVTDTRQGRRIRKARDPTRPTLTLYNGAVAIDIRDYKPEDFESLWRMDQACFPPGISYSKRELRDFMRHRGSFTLVAADEKEKLQGFLVAHCGTAGHVVTIDVEPGTRRAGVGSLLLREAEERMRTAGCCTVGLETAVDNLIALSFYKRHGYNIVRTWPRYYSNGVDALVLKKNLK